MSIKIITGIKEIMSEYKLRGLLITFPVVDMPRKSSKIRYSARFYTRLCGSDDSVLQVLAVEIAWIYQGFFSKSY